MSKQSPPNDTPDKPPKRPLGSTAVTRPCSTIGRSPLYFRRTLLAVLGILLGAVAVLAPVSFSTDGAAMRVVPWKGGERLQYRVSWANFVAAGELALECTEVSDPGKARLYRLAVRARSVDWVRTLFLNVNDSYESSVDAETLLPIQAQARLEHGNKIDQDSVRFDHHNRVVRLSNGQSRPLDPNTYDAATLMFILRTLDLSSGKTQVLRLLDKQTVHTLKAEAERTESIRVGQKDYQVARVAIKQLENGIARDSLRIRLYLTSDSRRVPVLMTAEPAWGTVRIELQ
jgi:hypothetical protein